MVESRPKISSDLIYEIFLHIQIYYLPQRLQGDFNEYRDFVHRFMRLRPENNKLLVIEDLIIKYLRGLAAGIFCKINLKA